MDLIISAYCQIHGNKVIVNDRLIYYQENFLTFADFIKSVYKQEQINYPKFYKMDSISKLGFLAADLILKQNTISGYRNDSVGVVLANSSSSLDTDIAHYDTIKDRLKYFPSPSVFVYTLPNIVVGEICIKNKIKGENVFLISETFDSTLLYNYTRQLFENCGMEACLCGWVEVLGSKYRTLITLIEKSGLPMSDEISKFRPLPFNQINLDLIFEHN
ncbi:MAG: hypothetical protein PHF97_05625 [Bacteroidales bacterium]|nr:hypothetical protein [Bacteroidales bacterium]MDD4603266.1 hypothetical protein [Bacteroidales bacterium]